MVCMPGPVLTPIPHALQADTRGEKCLGRPPSATRKVSARSIALLIGINGNAGLRPCRGFFDGAPDGATAFVWMSTICSDSFWTYVYSKRPHERNEKMLI